MKYFKNSDESAVYAFEEDGSQDEFIPEGLTPITEAEASAIREQINQRRFDAMTYSEKRALNYPPMTDFLDGFVKGDQAQIAKYIADCLAVKEKYPKPESV